MSHSPALPIHDYDNLSSPDPLASSIYGDNENGGNRHMSPLRQRSHSPTKHTTILEDITISTPQRTQRWTKKAFSSPSRTVSEQTLSPWKIRVTVEAEPENMNAGSTRTTTRTVKVPLREASSPIEMFEVSQRGRKSQGVATKSKRNGTPLRATSKTRTRRQSVTNLDITVLGDEGDSNDWTIKKSPRKRKDRQNKKKDEFACQNSPVSKILDPNDVQQSDTSAKKKKSGKDSFDIRHDTDIEPDFVADIAFDSDSPELRKIDLNRVSLRPRSASVRQKAPAGKDDIVSDVEPTAAVPLQGTATRQVSYASAESYPTPTSSAQGDSEEHIKSSDPVDEHEGFDTILESEGFTMIDLESIPSARHFFSSPADSQVSAPEHVQEIGTLRDGGKDLSTCLPKSTPKDQLHQLQHTRPRPTPIPSYLKLSEGDSDISSNVPSSPPVSSRNLATKAKLSQKFRTHQSTPSPYSSPKLPSPPKPPSPASLLTDTKAQKSSPPKLVRVVRAGVALQGVLSPKPQSHKATHLSPHHRPGTPKERLDDLFGGFDSGTRRELRAGLCFGEELAKRQRSSPNVRLKIGSDKPSLPHLQTQPQVRTQVWRGEAIVQHTPVPLHHKREEMVEKRSLSQIGDQISETKRHKFSEKNGNNSNLAVLIPDCSNERISAQSHVDARLKQERQWQHERETTSREIQNADASQVILIDDDNEKQISDDGNNANLETRQDQSTEADQEDVDVWLAEAEACNSSTNSIYPAGEDYFSKEEQGKQQERAREFINRPKRSLIPSPWKRGQDVPDASTFLTNGDVSGMFWQPPRDKVKFGAAEIERQKRQATGSLDANQIAGSPSESEETPSSHHQHNEILSEFDTLNQDESQQSDQIVFDEGQTSSEAAHSSEENFLSSNSSSIADADRGIEANEEGVVEEEGDLSYEESSLPHQAIKIPVNFNDSTLSNVVPALVSSSPSNAQDSSRPTTPRSAIKGGRISLGLETIDSTLMRKVVFSERSVLFDEEGLQSSSRIRSLSPTPPPYGRGFEQEKEVVEVLAQEAVDTSMKEKKGGWFKWLWGGAEEKDDVNPELLSTTSPAIPSADGAGDYNWEPAKSCIPSSSSYGTIINTSSRKVPTYLLPPSYPSDPTREPYVLLPVSGEFTNTHFRTLHIIYRKSQRPRFHAPKSIRGRIRELKGTKFDVDESKAGLGVFEWVVGQKETEVVERFMQELEWGYELAGGVSEFEWGWSERQLMNWLCRIVVGEVVRAEETGRTKKTVTKV